MIFQSSLFQQFDICIFALRFKSGNLKRDYLFVVLFVVDNISARLHPVYQIWEWDKKKIDSPQMLPLKRIWFKYLMRFEQPQFCAYFKKRFYVTFYKRKSWVKIVRPLLSSWLFYPILLLDRRVWVTRLKPPRTKTRGPKTSSVYISVLQIFLYSNLKYFYNF